MRHISIKLSCRLFSSFVLWFIFQMHYTKYCKDLLSNSAVEQVLIIPNSKINITTVVMLILLKWETVKIKLPAARNLSWKDVTQPSISNAKKSKLA